MGRIWFAAPIALCACLGSMVRAPEQIPASGVVEIWVPLLPVVSVDMLDAAGVGHSYADECRDAKRRGAELASRVRARAESRAEAGTLRKRAAAAARADDCATVRELDPQIRELDEEFHAVVFARDVAIARCLAVRDRPVPASPR